MPHLGEAGGGRRTDAPRRAVGADEIGKARFDRRVAAAQGVVIGVGNLRRVVLVIEFVVSRDFRGQTLQLRLGFGLAELVDRGLARWRAAHARAPAINEAAAARASAVIDAPDSMRAISSRRASADSSSTRVDVFCAAWLFSTRQWCAPRAATCGEWVTTRT